MLNNLNCSQAYANNVKIRQLEHMYLILGNKRQHLVATSLMIPNLVSP